MVVRPSTGASTAHPQHAGRKSEEESADGDGGGKSLQTAPHEDGHPDGAGCAHERRPQGRPPLRREDQEDAEPERDRDPREQPALLDLLLQAPGEPLAPIGAGSPARAAGGKRHRGG